MHMILKKSPRRRQRMSDPRWLGDFIKHPVSETRFHHIRRCAVRARTFKNREGRGREKGLGGEGNKETNGGGRVR
jgi:hypothetical protein